jgi:hypothetical protein
MKPRLNSKLSIGVSSIFLAPFFGCILLAYNLREIGKGKYGAYFIIGSLLWNFIMLKQIIISSNFLVQYLATNALGGLILSLFFWDKFFGTYDQFENRNPLKPILIYLAICSIPVLIILLTTKK